MFARETREQKTPSGCWNLWDGSVFGEIDRSVTSNPKRCTIKEVLLPRKMKECHPFKGNHFEKVSPFQRKPFRKRRWIVHPSFFRGKLAVRFRGSSWLSMPSMHIGASLNWDFRPRMWTLERGLSSNKKSRVYLSLSCGCVKFWCLRFLLLEVHVKFQFQKIVSRMFKVSLLFFAGCFKKTNGFGVLTPSILRYQNQYYGGYPYSQEQIQVPSFKRSRDLRVKCKWGHLIQRCQNWYLEGLVSWTCW